MAGGGLQHFNVSPRPFGSLNLLGLGWGLGTKGLTKNHFLGLFGRLISGHQTKQIEYTGESMSIISRLCVSKLPGKKTGQQNRLSTFLA